MRAVGEAEEADLLALQKLFDDDLLLGCAQERAGEEALRRLDGGGSRRTDDDALAGCEPVGLDHDGRMEELDRAFEFGRRSAYGIGRRGNVVPLQEALGEAFAGLEHGRRARGAEDAQTTLAQCVHNAQRERQFGADDGQAGLLGQGDLHHRVQALKVGGNAASDLRDAAVARRAHHFSDSRTALHRPSQGVFAPARTQNQDFHVPLPVTLGLARPQPRLQTPILVNAGRVSQTGGIAASALPYTGASLAGEERDG